MWILVERGGQGITFVGSANLLFNMSLVRGLPSPSPRPSPLGEGETHSAVGRMFASEVRTRLTEYQSGRWNLPLPKGEGRGEGEGHIELDPCSISQSALCACAFS